MNHIEAMKQALEALELHAKQYPHMQKGYTVDAITSLRQAIAEAEKQVSYSGNGTAGRENMTAPTGFFFQMPEAEKQEHGSPEDIYVEMHKHLNCPHCGGSGHIDDVAEKQEPNGYLWFTHHMEQRFTHYKPRQEQMIGEARPVYTHPQPKRDPLTDEQIDAIVVDEIGLDADADEMHGFARAIEAAHDIKENT